MSLHERYGAALMNTFGTPKIALARGEGAMLWDTDGKEYLDLLGGIAVNSLGHAHPRLVAAVSDQLSTLGHVSNLFMSEPQVRLAERLVELLGVDGRVFFSNSGAEANEAAFKLSRLTGRTHVVATEGAFHGRTMGSLALTHNATYRTPFEPLPGDVTWVPYGDADALEAAVTDRTAAVVVEPLQGEAGVNQPASDYLRRVREITSASGALMWLDEIQTGIGRTGTWFAHQNPALVDEVVVPDVITLAKGLGGGLPIGATIATGAAAQLLKPGNHGTTFGGNPVAAAAALAVLETIEVDGLLTQATEVGALLRDGLLADDRVSEVRGSGLMLGITLVEGIDSAAVLGAGLEAGYVLNVCAPDRLRFVPPLVISEEQVTAFLADWPALLDAAGVAQ